MLWTEEINLYFSSITLCWNPRIYPYIRTVSSKFDYTLDQQMRLNQPQHSVYTSPQILFTIPPHAEDFEIRIMLRRHVKNFDKSSNKIHFKLFTFDGQRIVYPIDSLRNSLHSQREVMSDVFIFENSHEYECYVLVLLDDQGCPVAESYEYFTLDVFSFIDIDLKELPMP